MDYSAYDTADFVCDDSFVAWVKEGRDGAHWEQVIKQYPGKQELILQARTIILAAAQLPPFQLKAQDQQQMWDQIRSQMDTTGMAPVKKSRFTYWYWAAAAAAPTPSTITISAGSMYHGWCSPLVDAPGEGDGSRVHPFAERSKARWQ